MSIYTDEKYQNEPQHHQTTKLRFFFVLFGLAMCSLAYHQRSIAESRPNCCCGSRRPAQQSAEQVLGSICRPRRSPIWHFRPANGESHANERLRQWTPEDMRRGFSHPRRRAVFDRPSKSRTSIRRRSPYRAPVSSATSISRRKFDDPALTSQRAQCECHRDPCRSHGR
jgi:hypothetical protein